MSETTAAGARPAPGERERDVMVAAAVLCQRQRHFRRPDASACVECEGAAAAMLSALPGAAASEGDEDDILRRLLVDEGCPESYVDEYMRNEHGMSATLPLYRTAIRAALRARSAPRPGGHAAVGLQAASAELHMAIGELQDIEKLNRSARQAVSLALGHMLKSADGIEAVLASGGKKPEGPGNG